MKSILIAHHDCEKYAKTLAPELDGYDVMLAERLGAASADVLDDHSLLDVDIESETLDLVNLDVDLTAPSEGALIDADVDADLLEGDLLDLGLDLDVVTHDSLLDIDLDRKLFRF